MTVDDVEGAIDLVAGLAARTTGERHDNDKGAVAVMTDPDGREFSLAEYYSEVSALAAQRTLQDAQVRLGVAAADATRKAAVRLVGHHRLRTGQGQPGQLFDRTPAIHSSRRPRARCQTDR